MLLNDGRSGGSSRLHTLNRGTLSHSFHDASPCRNNPASRQRCSNRTFSQSSLITLHTRRYRQLKQTPINTWQGVYAEVMRRLNVRIWKPGDLLPNEAALAGEFSCARSTVNRALQAVADEGFIERRRRGGTRVIVHPERKATFSIPVIRSQIEAKGCAYDYRLLNRRRMRPPKAVREAMEVDGQVKLLHIRALHKANKLGFVLENRWVNLQTLPTAAAIDFHTQSPNEWLLENVPVNDGLLMVSANAADSQEADALGCEVGEALVVEERLTRNAAGDSITWVRLIYAPGYQMNIKF
ncbi:MAG: GntR family transcriptional regulator [Granulosicoccus sp.]